MSTTCRPLPDRTGSRRRVVASTHPAPAWLAGHHAAAWSGLVMSSSTTSHERRVTAAQSRNARASASASPGCPVPPGCLHPGSGPGVGGDHPAGSRGVGPDHQVCPVPDRLVRAGGGQLGLTDPAPAGQHLGEHHPAPPPSAALLSALSVLSVRCPRPGPSAIWPAARGGAGTPTPGPGPARPVAAIPVAAREAAGLSGCPCWRSRRCWRWRFPSRSPWPAAPPSADVSEDATSPLVTGFGPVTGSVRLALDAGVGDRARPVGPRIPGPRYLRRPATACGLKAGVRLPACCRGCCT